MGYAGVVTFNGTSGIPGYGTDSILVDVHEVIEGQIAEPFSAEELKEIYKDGEDRYKREFPPGYKDTTKPVPDRYGDLVWWKELLRYDSAHKCPAIIVTDETKEDWSLRVHGKTISIRPELRREYYDAANQPVWLYTPERFIREASESLGRSVHREVLKEISDLTEDTRIQEAARELSTELLEQTRSGSQSGEVTDISPEIVRSIPATQPAPRFSEALRKVIELYSLDNLRNDSSLYVAEAVRTLLGHDILNNKLRASRLLFDAERIRRLLGGLDTPDNLPVGSLSPDAERMLKFMLNRSSLTSSERPIANQPSPAESKTAPEESAGRHDSAQLPEEGGDVGGTEESQN